MFYRSIPILLLFPCFMLLSLHAAEPQPVSPSPQAGYHVYAHAHNDYEHERPLLDALDNRFYSVEADVWFVDGEILVAHDQGDYKGSLKDLYLDPLQKRVDEKNSVHGDGESFYLWIDIKDGRSELRSALHELFNEYSMLSRYSADGTEEGPVTVILTGDAKSKEAFIQEYEDRRACRDSNHYSSDDPQADMGWQWYALSWSKYVPWKAEEEMSPELEARLILIVNDIHAKGRKVRFYAAPDQERYWQKALQVGVDLINTDRLHELNQFLQANPQE